MGGGSGQAARVQARTARSGFPPVVILVLHPGGLSVYPAYTNGQPRGDRIAYWATDDFSARSTQGLLTTLISINVKDRPTLQLETKKFPIGPNRYNKRVAQMIAQAGMSDQGPGAE